VRRGAESVILQWTHDSAFRFFPLIEHPELGLTLHPFDLATNKVLALVGRVEARDWIDILQCDAAVQPGTAPRRQESGRRTPYQKVGQCVLHDGELFRGDGAALREALARGEIRFHAGSIRGAFPRII
jgi:hypothetical protein